MTHHRKLGIDPAAYIGGHLAIRYIVYYIIQQYGKTQPIFSIYIPYITSQKRWPEGKP